MKPYIGIVHKDLDSAYGITFPDAPGCFSATDEIDDLFARAEEAIATWTEAMSANRLTIPETRELSEVRSDASWIESLTTSDFLIAVPARSRGAE